MRLLALALLLTGCLTPNPDVLGKDEYALGLSGGHKVLCAKAEMSPCGLRLTNCSNGANYYCMMNVEFIDLKGLAKRVEDTRYEDMH